MEGKTFGVILGGGEGPLGEGGKMIGIGCGGVQTEKAGKKGRV